MRVVYRRRTVILLPLSISRFQPVNSKLLFITSRRASRIELKRIGSVKGRRPEGTGREKGHDSLINPERTIRRSQFAFGRRATGARTKIRTRVPRLIVISCLSHDNPRWIQKRAGFILIPSVHFARVFKSSTSSTVYRSSMSVFRALRTDTFDKSTREKEREGKFYSARGIFISLVSRYYYKVSILSSRIIQSSYRSRPPELLLHAYWCIVIGAAEGRKRGHTLGSERE